MDFYDHVIVQDQVSLNILSTVDFITKMCKLDHEKEQNYFHWRITGNGYREYNVNTGSKLEKIQTCE